MLEIISRIIDRSEFMEYKKDYEHIYSIAIPLESIETGEEEIDKNATQEEPEDPEAPKINEENVFYAGSRRRNS